MVDQGVRASRVSRPRTAARWPLLCMLALVLVSDFQYRLRPPTETLGGRPDLFVMLEIAVYGAVAGMLFVRFRPAPRLRRPDIMPVLYYLAYAYAAVLVVAALYSPYPVLAAVRAGQAVVVVGLFAAIARYADRAALHLVAHGYLGLIAGAVVFGVVVPYERIPTQPDRFTWLYVHPVQAGEMMAVASVIAAAYLLCRPLGWPGTRWPRWLYLVLFAICFAGLIGSNTRGAMLGAVMGVTAVLWTRWQGSRKIEAAVVAAIVIVLVLLTSWSAIEDFFVRGESASRLASLNSRTYLWELAMQHVADNPLYGAGLTATRGLFLESMGLGGGHNAFVNVLVEIGVVGTAVWLALLAAIAAAAVRLTRHVAHVRVDGIIAVAVLSGLIVNSIFTEELGASANFAFTWLYVFAAWMIVAARSKVRND